MSDRSDEWPRIILHADMDAFFAAVEERDDPELRGKPVIVGGPKRRGVVSTANYEARKYGIHSAMPMAQAIRRCPWAVVVPPNFAGYEEASSRIMEVFSRYSPLVEPLSLDEAFVDMTGGTALFGSPEEMARAIKRDVADATGGLTVSVGVSTTKYVAKVASDFRKPDGLTVVEEARVASFLSPLPVSRLWGAGPKTAAALVAAGLHTIGDIAEAPPERLERLLGPMGAHLHQLARGVDPREVVPPGDPKSVGREYTLEEDVRGARAIAPHLRRAADSVARRLRERGLLAAGVRVKLKTARFELHTRQARLEPPTDSAGALVAAALGLLELFDLDAPMRLVGLAAFDLEAEGRLAQCELFADPARERARRLDRAVDMVARRFGDGALTRAEEREGGGARSDDDPAPSARRQGT